MSRPFLSLLTIVATLSLLAETAASLNAESRLTAVQQQPVFSSRTDLVLAHATVLDDKGQIVKGLTSADFVIKDNGVVVEETTVMADNVPLAVGIILNQEVTYYADPVLALLDMADALGPEDVIGGSNVRGASKVILTRDRREVSHAIIPDPAELRRLGGDWYWLPRSPWDALAETCTALAEWPGRRAILFVAGSEEWRRALQPNSDPRYSDVPLPRRSQLSPTVSQSAVAQTLERLGVLPQVVRFDRGFDTDIDKLATAAGGRTYKFGVREPLAARVNEIIEGLRGSYLLGFKPARLDGKTHKLEIRTVRSDLKVTGRTEYRAVR